MKLRTSFFNPTVLKKDITRFTPVWGLYSVLMLLILMVFSDNGSGWAANDFYDFLGSASLIQLAYGGICAAMLFGDLFNPRMCNALHAMSLRREGWFLTHLAAGLLFFLVPTGIFCGLMAVLLRGYRYLALIYFVASFLLFLFFFGVGAFSAMCAGNRLAMLALYGIINFLSLFVLCLTYVFYEPFLYGIEIDNADFIHYSPAWALSDARFVDLQYNGPRFEFMGYLADECAYLGWTSLTGLVFLGLALLIYRVRDLETAGDFISAKPAAPFFLVIFCLSVGMLLHVLGDAFGGSDLGYIFLAIGLVVGFFTGKMLLERTAKVFRLKTFLGFGVLLLALGLSIGAMALDVFGVVRYVPQQDQVKQVKLYTGSGWGNPAELTEPEDIQKVLEFHEERVNGYRYSRDLRIFLEYTLENGNTVSRYYDINRNEPYAEVFGSYLCRWQTVFGTDDWENFKSRVAVIHTNDGISLLQEAYGELLEAIKQDCEAGNLIQDYNFHTYSEVVYWVDIGCDYDPETNGLKKYISLQIFDTCENTIGVLKRYSEKNEG